ncbi:MAG: 50S ribosomal protein L24 [Deltaproteobacteria bacterium]|nr:50S ribosomal protein L24 [Deltaproteobacteria bacterium]
MKLEIKTGDKVHVLKGKFFGKEAVVLSVDKKTNRYKLDGLKNKKVQTKKGSSVELHGTFHVSNLKVVKPEAPKAEPVKETPKEETKPETPNKDS